jgi:PIN domain nuclease of toxin-antitoxin system
VILLDTHIWVSYVSGSDRLTKRQQKVLAEHVPQGLGVSVISCWEVAKLVELDRLELDRPVQEWVALALPEIRLIALTPEIAVASTQLPGPFHRDPADQILVATARAYDVEMSTNDRRIRAYPHPHVRVMENA